MQNNTQHKSEILTHTIKVKNNKKYNSETMTHDIKVKQHTI